MKQPCVYIVANKRGGTLYTGVTSNMLKRAFEHREGLVKGFSAKYGCKMLVWYELHETMIEAITREKPINAGSRAKKLALIEGRYDDLQHSSDGSLSASTSGDSTGQDEGAMHRFVLRRE